MVCGTREARVGRHYGAVTCYSCRAFFRRAQDRKRNPRCKQSEACNIDYSRDEKHCSKCRYDKCLAMGMLPDLVLNDEEKTERFKVSRSKKLSEQERPPTQARLPPDVEVVEVPALSQPGPSECYTNQTRRVVGQVQAGPSRQSVITALAKPPGWQTHNEGDTLILSYIHKKFGAGKRVLRWDKPEEGVSPAKRRSVIVMNSSYGLVSAGQTECVKAELSQAFSQAAKAVKEEDFDELSETLLFPNSFNLETYLNMDEERCFLDGMINMFDKSWNEIHLEENTIENFINFCRPDSAGDFKIENWVQANRQFRERYLNFICDLNMEINPRTMFELFKENLVKAQMLTYIYVYNLSEGHGGSWGKELEFVYSDRNMRQWNTRDPGISGKTMVTMMKSLPIPEEMKLKLLSLLKLNCNSTMQDQKVFILLILLVVINNESEIVLRIRRSLFNLLTRYLVKKGKDLGMEAKNISICFETLPKLTQMFPE